MSLRPSGYEPAGPPDPRTLPDDGLGQGPAVTDLSSWGPIVAITGVLHGAQPPSRSAAEPGDIPGQNTTGTTVPETTTPFR